MKTVKSLLVSAVLWPAFVAAVLAAVAPGPLSDQLHRHLSIHGEYVTLSDTQQKIMMFAGIGLSLLAGGLLARREPLASLLARRSTQWFLFLVNGSGAVFAYLALPEPKGIFTAAGLAVVSIGSGLGLLRRPATPSDSTSSAPCPRAGSGRPA